MDQLKEKADKFQELTDPRDEDEENNAEEPMDQRKEEEEEKEERFGEKAEAASIVAHPCGSLLQHIARACAWCCGMRDAFGDPKPSAADPAPAATDQSQGEEVKKTSVLLYMREAITRVRIGRPTAPGDPREASGGNGGVHH